MLTENEKMVVKVLNFIAEHDGIITNEEEVEYLLKRGLDKFILAKNRSLVKIDKQSYPIRIFVKSAK